MFNATAIRKVFEVANALIQIRPVNDSYETKEVRRAMIPLNWTIETYMLSVMQPCNRMLRKCLWLNEKIPCDQLFVVSKTTQGFCCSFNYKGTNKCEKFCLYIHFFLFQSFIFTTKIFLKNMIHAKNSNSIQISWSGRILCIRYDKMYQSDWLY